MNQCWFRHSARNLPLKDSMNALSVGLPGREKSSVTPFMYPFMARHVYEKLKCEPHFMALPEQQGYESLLNEQAGKSN
jgi:hypothetical protein